MLSLQHARACNHKINPQVHSKNLSQGYTRDILIIKHPAVSLPPRHPLSLSTHPLPPPPPPHPSPGPLPPPQATGTRQVLGPSPRAGGRPADLEPAVAAAASGGRFYPLLRSEASGSPHPAASMSPTSVFPHTPSGGPAAGSRTLPPARRRIPLQSTTSTQRSCSTAARGAARGCPVRGRPGRARKNNDWPDKYTEKRPRVRGGME